jgi:hypothetical protein
MLPPFADCRRAATLRTLSERRSGKSPTTASDSDVATARHAGEDGIHETGPARNCISRPGGLLPRCVVASLRCNLKDAAPEASRERPTTSNSTSASEASGALPAPAEGRSFVKRDDATMPCPSRMQWLAPPARSEAPSARGVARSLCPSPDSLRLRVFALKIEGRRAVWLREASDPARLHQPHPIRLTMSKSPPIRDSAGRTISERTARISYKNIRFGSCRPSPPPAPLPPARRHSRGQIRRSLRRGRAG